MDYFSLFLRFTLFFLNGNMAYIFRKKRLPLMFYRCHKSHFHSVWVYENSICILMVLYLPHKVKYIITKHSGVTFLAVEMLGGQFLHSHNMSLALTWTTLKKKKSLLENYRLGLIPKAYFSKVNHIGSSTYSILVIFSLPESRPFTS